MLFRSGRSQDLSCILLLKVRILETERNGAKSESLETELNGSKSESLEMERNGVKSESRWFHRMYREILLRKMELEGKVEDLK